MTTSSMQDLIKDFVVLIIILVIVFIIYNKGNVSATELKDRFSSALDKEKLDIFITEPDPNDRTKPYTCFDKTSDPNKLKIKNVKFDYKEYVEEGKTVEFILTVKADMRPFLNPGEKIKGVPEKQLSSIGPISCTREKGDKDCEFRASTDFEFSLTSHPDNEITYNDGSGDVALEIEYMLSNMINEFDITAWKNIGFEKDTIYQMTLDNLIKKRSDYYLKTFRVDQECPGP
ncbi:MAG: hypothetical protein QMD85_00155 [Candidatus Aenigmarchaeota archaeon]|nr:hypothetical protein [Candidatus Aenigmarchaeota archaeon]MDI6721939.1 hypothetical protein [Candidatus Aenigmarchaeota archaeon]